MLASLWSNRKFHSLMVEMAQPFWETVWCQLVKTSSGKEPDCNAVDPGSIPGLRISPREGNGNPLQYSCLGNPTEEPGRLQSMGATKESDMTLWLKQTITLHMVKSMCEGRIHNIRQVWQKSKLPTRTVSSFLSYLVPAFIDHFHFAHPILGCTDKIILSSQWAIGGE